MNVFSYVQSLRIHWFIFFQKTYRRASPIHQAVNQPAIVRFPFAWAAVAVTPATGIFPILHTNDIHGRHRPFGVAPGNATAQTGDVGCPPSSFERAG